MGLGSLEADIIERRCENDAHIIFEYQYPEGKPKFTPLEDPALATRAAALGMTPAELIALLELLGRLNKECAERLSREKTMVYTWNEQRTRVQAYHLLSKGKAVEMTNAVMGGELLDLDGKYGGMLLRDNYIFVSEQTAVKGLTKYEPEPVALLNGLLAERLAVNQPH